MLEITLSKKKKMLEIRKVGRVEEEDKEDEAMNERSRKRQITVGLWINTRYLKEPEVDDKSAPDS